MNELEQKESKEREKDDEYDDLFELLLCLKERRDAERIKNDRDENFLSISYDNGVWTPSYLMYYLYSDEVGRW